MFLLDIDIIGRIYILRTAELNFLEDPGMEHVINKKLSCLF